MADLRRRPGLRYNAVVASAAVMTQRPAGLRKSVKAENWHDEAWDFYDSNGELRFGISWIANGVSRVNLIGARQPDNGGDEPAAVGGEGASAIEAATAELVASIANGPTGQSQMMARLATLLSVAGVGWVLIETQRGERDKPGPEWSWSVLENSELRDTNGKYEVSDDTAQGGWRQLAAAHVLIKVWRPHPRNSNKPDSACHAALPVLRQIAMLDDHVFATAQSRLAGAGLLVLPTEIEFVPLVRPGSVELIPVDGEAPPGEPDFVDTLIETMTVPIADRGSASAVVPLTIKVPGEYVDKVKHITFWSEFQEGVSELRQAAIKRLALALDMPPEIVTGVSGMNHWGAWRVQEEAITLHIEPLAEIICDALTLGYLHPALAALKFPPEDILKQMVFFDVTELTVRPDKSADAGAAYDRIELSGEAYRREAGLSETDKPTPEETERRILMRVLDRAPQFAPSILPALGYAVVIEEESNEQRPRTAVERDPGQQIGEPPPTDDAEQPVAASAALVEACDAIVYRALERAGNRLRIEAGRGKPGGQAVVACVDPTTFHAEVPDLAWEHRDKLLHGAWDRVPVIAHRHGIDPGRLTRTLDNFTLGLFVAGEQYEPHHLAKALDGAVGVPA